MMNPIKNAHLASYRDRHQQVKQFKVSQLVEEPHHPRGLSVPGKSQATSSSGI